jgi:nicotinate phosphoribosyltransferase
MEPIIRSLLDTDFYKFSMQQGILTLFPSAEVSYKFKNRGSHRFNSKFLYALQEQIKRMESLRLSYMEYCWLKQQIPFLKPQYIEYLFNYRFNPEEVQSFLDENNDLVIDIKGLWHSTILWEVPLMAIISELYFKIVDTDWDLDPKIVKKNAKDKGELLSKNFCYFADFGTRRRRSFAIQDTVISELKEHKTFVGTSNVFLAMKYDVKPIGTMAHEFIMGISVLEGLRNCNYFALRNWNKVYKGSLGIALTDTYGNDNFFQNFTLELSKLYDGVRHDSGDPFLFVDKVISHYKKMRIDPLTKTIVFSDGLNTDLAIDINKYCEGKIKCSFGIGTHFTNDGFKKEDGSESRALNMVIKLNSVFHNGLEVLVAKLSNNPGKTQGHPDAIKEAKYVFLNEPLS